MKKTEFEKILKEHLSEIPEKFDRDYRIAAVVVPIIWGDEPELLLTRRADTLESFRGQIAFPGGRPEPGEAPLETALREFEEEVGISRDNLHVLGALRVEKTRLSDFMIYPIVGVLDSGLTFRKNPEEVAEIFTIRIPDLPTCEKYHPLIWSIFQCGEYTIWGATYRIIKKLLGVFDEAKIPY